MLPHYHRRSISKRVAQLEVSDLANLRNVFWAAAGKVWIPERLLQLRFGNVKDCCKVLIRD